MWNNKKTDTINQNQMYSSHRKGGKKVLDIELRNKVIHLTWLKAYLNIGTDCPTWAFFADAIIKDDIPPSHNIDTDLESRILPIMQDWEPRSKASTLLEDLKVMMKLAKGLKVQLSAVDPSEEVQSDLPIWYHVCSVPSIRKLYKTRAARCLRKKHGICLVKDALQMLEQTPDGHTPQIGCRCTNCHRSRNKLKCSHPHKCVSLTATLIKKIYPKWNLTINTGPVHQALPTEGNKGEDNTTTTFDPLNTTTELKEAITIFGKSLTEPASRTSKAPPPDAESTLETTVYTNGACINNGRENARASSGVWYGENDLRNRKVQVPQEEQSNQTGELFAVLLAVRNHPGNKDLCIVSDSKYVIEGLTKHTKKWEDRGWIDVQHRELFWSITAWLRWRSGKTKFKWVKGHKGNRHWG